MNGHRPFSLGSGNWSKCPTEVIPSVVTAVSSGRLWGGKVSFVSRCHFCPRCATSRPSVEGQRIGSVEPERGYD
jgi:hypothetical protein